MVEKIKLLPRNCRGATSRLTFVRLREVLDYDPETGIFTWKYRARVRNPSWNARFAGKIANGYDRVTGYNQVMIDNIKYKPNRLAWLYMTGEWPNKEVDHKDLDRTNNRWANLRQATHSQNMWNSGRQINNSTGYKGVYWYNKTKGNYRAQISANGHQYFLGYFDTAEQAYAAYARAAKRLHGEFARLE